MFDVISLALCAWEDPSLIIMLLRLPKIDGESAATHGQRFGDPPKNQFSKANTFNL